MKKIDLKKWLFFPLLSALMIAAVPSVATARASEKAVYISERDPLAALSLLDETRAANIDEEYRFVQALDVGYGKVYRFEQLKDGKSILGQEVTVSADKDGKVLSVNGSYLSANTEKATVGAADALQTVREQVGGENFSATEIYFENNGKLTPAYNICSDAEGGMTTVVSAANGEILLSAPLSSSVAISMPQTNGFGENVMLDVEYDGEQYILADETRNIFTYNHQSASPRLYTSTDGIFTDDIAVSVFENTVRAYDFYTKEENIGAVRYGINNGNDLIAENRNEHTGELSIRLYVHYNYYGYRENAAFDTVNATMYVGDGRLNGDLYRQGQARDVIAHEFQHGVTHYTAGLIYEGDSGAIDEAISDVFGMLVEGHEPSQEEFWLIGEDAVANESALRSVIEPAYPYRSSARNKYVCNFPHRYHDEYCDNNGVHHNSTIISNVAYKMWNEMPDYFTKERMGKLWYATLCSLTSRCTFASFARVFRETAENLGFEEKALETIDHALFLNGLIDVSDVHIVTFVNYDGSVLKECVVKDGEAAIPPKDPARPSDARYVYTFIGWDVEFDRVTADMRITARYRSNPRYYTVTFLDAEGNVLETQQVAYGGSAKAPLNPVKASDEHYDYEFSIWDSSFQSVQGDITVKPVFTRYLCYQVLFMSEGEQIASVRVREKQAATPPETPHKESDLQFDYVFDGWDGNYSYVTQDTTVNAVFREVPRKYTLTFLSEGGQMLEKVLGYGESYDLPTPEPREGYTFDGWYLDEGFTKPAASGSVTGEETFYAKWQRKSNDIVLITVICSGVAAVSVAAALLLKKRKKK